MGKGGKSVLVSRLRFPDFDGIVSALPLAAVADFVSAKTSVDQITPAQYVSTENLLSDFGGMKPAVKLPSVSSVTSFRPNDVLVSNIRPYLRKVWQSDIHGGASNDVLVVRATEPVGAHYLAAILRSDLFIDYIMRGAKGVKMPRGEISMIQEFPVPCPCANEQQKIADCLSSLDNLITAETQKLDALKTHKKGLMQQLFPREGETVPRLRFPEFREAPDWGTKPLGDIFETTSGGTPSRSEANYWNGNIPWITTSLMNLGVITGAEEFISEYGLNNSSAKLLPKGTVLIAMYGQGKTRGQVAILEVEAATNQACAALLPKDGISPYFVFLNLNGQYEAFRNLSNCGGQENLSQALIRDFPFAYPSDEQEQQRIVECFSSLDDLITDQNLTVNALKTHKKGLMQQLFPVLDEIPA
jgi:type I restriction enzyme S subunit